MPAMSSTCQVSVIRPVAMRCMSTLVGLRRYFQHRHDNGGVTGGQRLHHLLHHMVNMMHMRRV
jgi:hypothetical protein